MFFVPDADLDSNGNEKGLESILGKHITQEEVRKLKLCLEKIERLQRQNELLQKRLDALR